MEMGALTMLNECGDTTIAWTPDRDHEMEQIIQKKMDEGVMFYVIDPRMGTRARLTEAGEANRHRLLAIPDEDMIKFVSSGTPGTAAAVATPEKPARNPRRTKNAKEAAKSETVAVRPRAGG